MTTDTGGSAFPTGLSTGMTLRDHFAGLAMQPMVDTKGAAYLNQGGYEAISMMAYRMADAMLERRKK